MDSQLRALADPTRRTILSRLAGHELPAGEIARGFRVTRPAISRHLRVLREAKLVAVRREAQARYYSADADAIRKLREWFDDYWDAALPRLKSAVEKDRRRHQKKEDKK